MKARYESPEMELVLLDPQDVIATSGTCGLDWVCEHDTPPIPI